MKRFLIIILVAISTIIILLLIYRPEIISDIWLWIVGLIGLIVALFQRIGDWIKKNIKDLQKTTVPETPAETPKPDENSSVEPGEINLTDNHQNFTGTTITILRYFDDGETTLGLLFVDDTFFCYTLEDTFNEVKIQGNTRIPEGKYKLNFNLNETPLTLKYRQKYPWFTYHLEVKNVKDFKNIYIHSGGTHQHTEGCILISTGLNVTDTAKFLNQSRQTFRNFYLQISNKLKSDENIRLFIFDENWFSDKFF